MYICELCGNKADKLGECCSQEMICTDCKEYGEDCTCKDE